MLFKPGPIQNALGVHKHVGLVLDCGENADLGSGIEHILTMPKVKLERILDSRVAESCAIACREEVVA
jgi:hypothetical protein